MPLSQYDIMIIGAGPAGMTAALYGPRLGLKTVVLGDIPGGSTYMIEDLANFPGFIEPISGAQFGTRTFQRVQQEGVQFTLTRLESLQHEEGLFTGVDVDGNKYRAPCAILATGRVPRRLAVPNANIKGIHFCSLCDGPLYRGQNATLAVVGSDNTAGQHALVLARIALKVLLICRSKKLQMDAVYQNMLTRRPNIELRPGMEVVGWQGKDVLKRVNIVNQAGTEISLPVDGLFLAIGWQPNSRILAFDVRKTEQGYLQTDTRLMSSLPGLFAAGDVRDTDMYKVLTACADGARAAKNVAEYLARRC